MRRHEKNVKIKIEKEKTDLEKDNEIKKIKRNGRKIIS